MTNDPRARRDAGLHRVRQLSRWAVAAGLALTGAFSVVAARAFPGDAASATQSPATTAGTTTQDTTSATTPTTSAVSASGSSSSSGSLQAPVTVPSTARGSSHVRSGGS